MDEKKSAIVPISNSKKCSNSTQYLVDKCHFSDEFDEVNTIKDSLSKLPIWHKVGQNNRLKLLQK